MSVACDLITFDIMVFNPVRNAEMTKATQNTGNNCLHVVKDAESFIFHKPNRAIKEDISIKGNHNKGEEIIRTRTNFIRFFQ